MSSRGQSALEYVETYGWAILAVMVVGIALNEMGYLKMGGETISQSGFGKLKPFLSSTSLTTGGEFTTVFTNTLGEKITLTTTGLTITVGGVACTGTDVTPLQVSPGNQFKITGTGCPTGNDGDPYDLTITVPYTINVGNVETEKQDSGKIHGAYT
ncbi:MAG: hypothetical protein KKD39_05460 [Candidatus Altiarchaeota archaeon]|nr:hypothetical protein [Candidatus Altiarchaeota archaeon]